jgi:hypothetical protein
MTILFNLASRSRPERFFETLDNIIVQSASNNFFVVAKLDDDDMSMNDPLIKQKIADHYPMLHVKWGASTSKIHAINRDLEGWDYAILVNCSDDMRFKTFGFDNIIRDAMPADLDGFVHLMDDYAKERVCTVSIVGRQYYKRDGYIYHPDYYSMWADDEETEKAKIRNRYVLVPGTHLEHLHYTNDRKAIKDELYWRNDTYNADKEVYLRRKANNFYL